MNDPDRVRALRELRILLADIYAMAAYPKAGATNLARLHDAQLGVISARYDGDGGHSTAVSDPTVAGVGRPDPATRDLADIDHALTRLAHHAERARRVLAAYPPPHHAGDADRLALTRSNSRPDPRCENCASIPATDGAGSHWSDADPRRKGPTDVGGRLPQPMTLCAWCCNYAAGQGTLPSKEQLEAHRDGRRVLVKDTTPRRPQ